MKNNLFDPSTQQSILERIQQLEPDTPRRWGKMSQGEVLCHMADPFRDLLNLRHTKPAVPRLLQPIMRLMVLSKKDWKPNTPTLKIYRQGNGGGGTPPTDFATDKAALTSLIEQFCSKEEGYRFGPHPGLGQLDRTQNGFFMWKHLDHHLREFGL